jgi:hypothetical protein
MGVLFTFVVLFCVPTAFFWLVTRLMTWFATAEVRRPRRLSADSSAVSAAIPSPVSGSVSRAVRLPTGAELTKLANDLARLGSELDRSVRNGHVARTRVNALGLAYDDTLLAGCRAVGFPFGERAPLDPVIRLQAEATLAQNGVHW